MDDGGEGSTRILPLWKCFLGKLLNVKKKILESSISFSENLSIDKIRKIFLVSVLSMGNSYLEYIDLPSFNCIVLIVMKKVTVT